MTVPGLSVSLKLEGRSCLVVGSGAEAHRRVRTLLDCGASVTWLGTRPGDDTSDLPAGPEYREFSEEDLEGVRLAVLTDRDDALASRMNDACRSRNVLFCAIDQPAHGDFSHVAVVRQGPVTLSISTNGRAPALARHLRDELSSLLSSRSFLEFIHHIERLRASTPRSERAAVMNREVARLSVHGEIQIAGEGGHSNSGKPDSGSGAG